MPAARSRVEYVPDGWAALRRLIVAIERDDGRDLIPYRSPGHVSPEAIHAYAKERIRYMAGEGQRWATPVRTLAGGYGDCGNSSRAIIALARLHGYPARLRAFARHWPLEPGPLARTYYAPGHVAAQIGDPRTNTWEWAEVTLDAHYGEHPLAAARRLRIMTDLKEVDPNDERLIPTAPDTVPETPASKSPTTMTRALDYPSDPQQVPATKTPVTVQDMHDAMVDAYAALFGAVPSEDSILVLLSQWGIETTNGKSMIQYNVGNFKHATGDGWNWSTFQTTECDAAGTCTPQEASFAAYPDLDTGVQVYIQSLHTRWPLAWPAVLAGDPVAFATALSHPQAGHGAYYTAPVSQYQNAMQARFDAFSKMDLGNPSLPLAAAPLFVLGLGLAGAAAVYATQQGWLPSGWWAPLAHPLRALYRIV
jgi:hypothetical protein